jgi:hypothetical protein
MGIKRDQGGERSGTGIEVQLGKNKRGKKEVGWIFDGLWEDLWEEVVRMVRRIAEKLGKIDGNRWKSREI